MKKVDFKRVHSVNVHYGNIPRIVNANKYHSVWNEFWHNFAHYRVYRRTARKYREHPHKCHIPT